MKTNRDFVRETALRPDYKQEIAALLRGNLAPRQLGERLREYHENDIASAMALLKKEERGRLCSVLDPETLAEVFSYVEDLAVYLGELSARKKAEILSRLEAPIALEYLRGLEKPERGALLALMEAGAQRELALVGSFDEDEIGGRMTTNYIAIRVGISIRQAMRELVAQAAENDNISTIYVLDAEDVFYGAIDLKDLIIARETTDLETIITNSYPYVYAHERVEDCVGRLQAYSEDSIPVLDEDNRLQGALTAQDVTELVREVLDEGYAQLAGLPAEEDLREPLGRSVQKRLPWLIVLLGLGLLVSSVVGLFEEVVAHLALIVCFQSLVLDMAGNVGTQSLAVTVRVLMGEQLTGRQTRELVAKEAKIGLCNGLILGLLSFVGIGLYLGLLRQQPWAMAFTVSACTGIALAVSMLLSSVTGTTIPLLFKRLRIDPAVASGPLITTANDLVAVVTYYGLAWFLLIRAMGL